MKKLGPKKASIAYSFGQLIQYDKNQYSKESDLEKKQEIVSRFICDPEVSYDFLDKYIKKCLSEKADTNDIYNSIDSYYGVLKYSLSKEKNNIIYKSIRILDPNQVDTCHKYLAFNDPIENFKNVSAKYLKFLNEINDKNKTAKNLEIINKHIDEMENVYNIDLETYYYPPTKEYPIYSYNFYSFLLYKILKKFRKKKITQPFANNINNNPLYNDEEKKMIHYSIGLFFEDVRKLFEKLNYDTIQKDLKILKVIFFYFKNLEHSRNYSFRKMFLNIINCLDSEPITSDILKRFKFFRKNFKTQLKEEDWNSIGINEILYIDNNPLYPVKIKHFKKDILTLEDMPLQYALMLHSIDDLNIDGLIQNSIIKYDDKIEEYSKKLLQKIFSSDMYRNYFLFHDKRFDSQKAKKAKLLESIFRGENKQIIFEEIWDNIFFLPIPNQELSGYSQRPQYTMFINSEPDINPYSSFQKIIPRFHSHINTLIHEFTHNIALLLAANLEDDGFGTSIKNDDEDLYNLQVKYSKKYNQDNIIYKKFKDFGDLMEVKLYGIRPRKFKTFSGLFCLNCDSYNLSTEDFREICVELYNVKINNEDNNMEYLEKCGVSEKYDLKKILEDLMGSEIAKLLKQYFFVDNGIKNESFVEDGKPRENYNYVYNEEFSVNTDYCDKLDEI